MRWMIWSGTWAARCHRGVCRRQVRNLLAYGYCGRRPLLTVFIRDGYFVIKSILIVDDSAEVRNAVRGAFERDNHFQVCGEAEDGQEAIDSAHQLKPDLIVLDFSMPVMNGLEAGRFLSVSLPAIPMILYTFHTGKFMEAKAKAAGFKALVSKSEDINLLIVQALQLLGLLAIYPAT